MSKKAIIVESPTKTRTLGRFLGKEYLLLASRGHVRDLPQKDLAVDVEHDFAPSYEVIPRQRKTLKELAQALRGVEEVYLASDPDREGEAIAWHLAEALDLPAPRRIEFSEITEPAVREALAHPREIDLRLVNAQQARRVLDRLVGYEISPLLWRRLAKGNADGGLSAGRVQSVALRLVVDREREILAFVPEEYWSLDARLTPQDREHPFTAQLKEKDGEKVEIATQEQAEALVADLGEQQFVVAGLEDKPRKRNPWPPFITSTLQRGAAGELGFSSSRTMRVAQQLYEGVELNGDTVGLITYMRTDSTHVAASARAEAVAYITEQFGEDHVGPGVRGKKAKGAQEAHECIRPTSVLRTPQQLASALDADQARLYELIWRRFVASQMAPAVYQQRAADIQAGPYRLRATCSRVTFPGFLTVWPEKEEQSEQLPALTVGETLDLLELLPEQHFTQPPPRYNEGSLVQALEELGIGRPSTYAPTVETLRQRKYVRMEKRNFVPTRLGVAVCDWLLDHFPAIVDVEFTARMEGDLDTVEEGERDWVELLADFWGDFAPRLAQVKEQPPPRLAGESCPQCGGALLVKYSALGKFAGCENYPECDYTRDLSGLPEAERSEPELLEENCPQCGSQLQRRSGRRGEFIGCSSYPKCDYTRDAEAEPGQERPAPELLEEACSQCGKPLQRRTGRRGEFIGCSGYPKCRYTRDLEGQATGAEEAAAPAGDCPQCGAALTTKRGRGGPFVGCSAYPQCKYIQGQRSRPQPVATELPCEQCGKPLVLRQGRRGPFLGCSGYPKCRFTREPGEEELAQLPAPPGADSASVPQPEG